MGAIKTAADAAYREWNTDGVPASGEHRPEKTKIRALFDLIDARLNDLGKNIRELGAVNGGDIKTPLIDAAAALSAEGGGKIIIPAGDFTCSGEVAINSNIEVVGAGRGATRITFTSATLNFFAATSKTFMRFADMTIDCSVAKSAGAAFDLTSCSVVVFRNVEVLNHFRAFRCTNCATIWWDESEIGGIVGTSGAGVELLGGNDYYLRHVFTKTASESIHCLAGFRVRATGGAWLEGCGSLWAIDGLLIDPGDGQVVEHLFVDDSAFDTCSGNGIKVAPTGTGISRRNVFSSSWTATNALNGVLLDDSGGAIGSHAFSDHRSYQNGRHGVLVEAGTGFSISSSWVSGNSTSGSGTYDGVSIAAGITDFNISGNRCGAFDSFGNSQRYGIAVAAGGSDRYRIAGNDCHNNITGGILDGGATTGKQVFGNLPNSAVERLRAAGANYSLPPSAGWQLDSDTASFTLASSAEITLTTGSGLLVLTLDSSGGTALALLGGGAVSITQIGSSFANTASPSLSQIGVYYASGSYRIKNGFAATQTIYAGSWKTRPAN